MFKDVVSILDRGVLRLRSRAGAVIAGKSWDEGDDQGSVVTVKGWVSLVMRERGKIVPGSRREGNNIWTNSGKEFLAMLSSYESAGTPFRQDRVAYIGVGTGTQVTSVGVLQVAEPAAYTAGQFLAPIIVPATFPLSPLRTSVRYHRTFADNEITLTPGSQVDVTELGLFTDGDPSSSNTPGTRDTTLASATAQAPIAYKSFEPVTKTDGLELDVFWEIKY
jgi:hypothetical protein